MSVHQFKLFPFAFSFKISKIRCVFLVLNWTLYMYIELFIKDIKHENQKGFTKEVDSE